MTEYRSSRAPACLRVACAAAALAWAAPSIAAEADAAAAPSASAAPVEPSAPDLPLWEAGLGAAVFSTPAYPGADQRSTRGLALPFLLYRGKVLRADQQGIGARLVNTDRIEFDVGFAASLPAHSSDVAARRGMPDLGTLVEFGPRVKLHLADLGEDGRLRFELPLRTVIEARGGLRRQGWTLEPRLVWAKRGEDDRWSLETHVGALFGDRRIHGYFYDVDPRYATPERLAYRAESGLMLVRAGLSGTWRMNPDLRLFGFLRFDSYAGAANRDSPLFKQNAGTSAGIGLAWTFARSSAREGN